MVNVPRFITKVEELAGVRLAPQERPALTAYLQNDFAMFTEIGGFADDWEMMAEAGRYAILTGEGTIYRPELFEDRRCRTAASN